MTHGSHEKPRRGLPWVSVVSALFVALGIAGAITLILILDSSSPGTPRASRSAPVSHTTAAPIVTAVPKTPKPSAPATAAPRTYVVKAGDNLWGIAARQLGNPADWSQIATANHLSGNATLTVGEVLKL